MSGVSNVGGGGGGGSGDVLGFGGLDLALASWTSASGMTGPFGKQQFTAV